MEKAAVERSEADEMANAVAIGVCLGKRGRPAAGEMRPQTVTGLIGRLEAAGRILGYAPRPDRGGSRPRGFCPVGSRLPPVGQRLWRLPCGAEYMRGR
jgi:hypothetical protein